MNKTVHYINIRCQFSRKTFDRYATEAAFFRRFVQIRIPTIFVQEFQNYNKFIGLLMYFKFKYWEVVNFQVQIHNWELWWKECFKWKGNNRIFITKFRVSNLQVIIFYTFPIFLYNDKLFYSWIFFIHCIILRHFWSNKECFINALLLPWIYWIFCIKQNISFDRKL